MAAVGRPPKPVEQHKRKGSYRADRHGVPLAQVPAIGGAVPITDVPLADAVERVLDQGVSWLGVTDTPALVMLRDLLEERAVLRDAVLVGAGVRKDLRELDKQIIGLFGQLGFDPAARSKLGLAEVVAQSKLQKLRGA